MNIKRLIPNLFTMLNLFCGCVALVMVSNNDPRYALFFVALGIFFDFFDGFFARKFGVAGPLGVQLDSLADMVTSGVVPGFVMYKMIEGSCIASGINNEWLPYLGFVITLGACYRLAKFNIDTRQSDSFIGLPTPANSLFFTSLPLIPIPFSEYNHSFDGVVWVLLLLCFLSAYVMNAEIPLFSLKIKDFSFAKYKLQIFFLLTCLAMFALLQIAAVPLIIILYVLLSVINNIVSKSS